MIDVGISPLILSNFFHPVTNIYNPPDFEIFQIIILILNFKKFKTEEIGFNCRFYQCFKNRINN